MAAASFRLPKICLHCRLINKVHFRLMCIVQTHLCLRSLIYLQNVPDDLFQLLSIGLVRLKKLLALLVPVDQADLFFNPLLTPVVKVFRPLNLKFYQIIILFSQTNASSRFHASLRKQLTLFSWCCHWFSPWNDVRETGRNSLLMTCYYLGLCGCRFSLLKGTQIWVVNQIGRATWQICFNQSDALPRSRLWCIISVEYQCLFLLNFGHMTVSTNMWILLEGVPQYW